MSTIDREQFRLWRRKHGVWYVVTGSGANTQRVSTRTKVFGEAEKFRAQFIAGLENTPPPPTVAIDELLVRYREEHGKSTRSVKTIDYHIKVLKPFFGDLLPVHVTNKSLKDYVADRRKKRVQRKKDEELTPISDGTILRELGTLKAALNFAAGNRWIPPLPPLQSPVPHPPPRDLWLSRAQARKLSPSGLTLRLWRTT